MRKNTILIILLAFIFSVLLESFYVIDEREQAIITLFKKPVGKPIVTAGLKVKIPFFYRVHKFPKYLLEWDGEKREIPTKDKTYIWVDVFARWKIVDPLKFFLTVTNEFGAQQKLDNIINSAIRDQVASYPLIETVRSTNRKMDLSGSGLDSTADMVTKDINAGRNVICSNIVSQVNKKLTNMGIEVVDVKFKRINYTDRVLKDVYNRMIAERKQIAEKFRSEGKGESQKIHGEREKELKTIYSEAYMKAQIIKGNADAKAAEIYAKAYQRDPEFFSFLKSMELYDSVFDSNSVNILSTDNNLMKYFTGQK